MEASYRLKKMLDIALRADYFIPNRSPPKHATQTIENTLVADDESSAPGP
jgi:hypothetical protein